MLGLILEYPSSQRSGLLWLLQLPEHFPPCCKCTLPWRAVDESYNGSVSKVSMLEFLLPHRIQAFLNSSIADLRHKAWTSPNHKPMMYLVWGDPQVDSDSGVIWDCSATICQIMAPDLHHLGAQHAVACESLFFWPALTNYVHLWTCSQAPLIRALSGHDKVIFPAYFGKSLEPVSPLAFFLSTLLLKYTIRIIRNLQRAVWLQYCLLKIHESQGQLIRSQIGWPETLPSSVIWQYILLLVRLGDNPVHTPQDWALWPVEQARQSAISDDNNLLHCDWLRKHLTGISSNLTSTYT